MADSDNESDFASAESDHEDADSGVETKDERPKAPSSDIQLEEDEGEGEEEQERNDEINQAVTGKEQETVEETKTAAVEEKVKEESKSTESTTVAEDKKSSSEVEPAPAPQAAAVKEPPSSNSGEGDGGGGWGWGGWGKSLWSSVSTVTGSAQALGQKVSSAIASVEDALGLPSPEDLAEKQDTNTEEVSKQADEMVEHDTAPEERETVVEEPHRKEKEDNRAETEGNVAESQATSTESGDSQDTSYATGVSSFFTGFASMMQTTGKDFVHGGLDALETLGKKTMEVLTEGDPGLKEKRAIIGGGKTPTLSQLLREAKADSEERGEGAEVKGEQTPLSYSRLFDEYKGVVHLEALDLLSKECESKVRSGYAGFTGEKLRALREKMGELTQAFKVEEEAEVLDDDSSQLPEVMELFSDINVPVKVDRLMKVSDSWREKIAITSEPVAKDSQGEDDRNDGGEEGKKAEGEGKEEGAVAAPPAEAEDPNKAKRAACDLLYENGLRSLAELTSASIELFRKMSEVSLLPDAQKNDSLLQAEKFNRLTVIVSKELDCLASVHSEAITELDLPDSNSCVTSLYLEASNSSSYVQDAFQLLLPVLKFVLMQQWLAEEPAANVLTRK